MIGVIKDKLVFEFRDMNQLAISLDKYIEQYDSDTLFITPVHDTSILGILIRGEWKLIPNLEENRYYHIYCGRMSSDYMDLSKNDELPLYTATSELLGPQTYRQKCQKYPAVL